MDNPYCSCELSVADSEHRQGDALEGLQQDGWSKCFFVFCLGLREEDRHFAVYTRNMHRSRVYFQSLD